MTTTIDKSMLKEKINAALSDTGLRVTYISVNPYKTQSARDAFDTHEDLYDDMMNDIDSVTVYGKEGRALWEHIAGNNEIDPTCDVCSAPQDIIDFIRDVLNDIVTASPEVMSNFLGELCEFCEEHDHDLFDDICNEEWQSTVTPDDIIDAIVDSFAFEDIDMFTPELMKRIDSKLYDWDWSNVGAVWNGDDHPNLDASNYGNERDEVEALFGIDLDDHEASSSDEDLEALAYWTIYFEPLHFDVDAANRCGLTPFKYTGDNRDYELLALGGCGMDLSPKLDAYQALTLGTIPGDSQFIKQYDYAVHVVGREIAEEVMTIVTRQTPEVTIELGEE